MDIRICEINPDYIDYLHSFDHKVSLEHPEHVTRKFI
jgi:hypothetical protein